MLRLTTTTTFHRLCHTSSSKQQRPRQCQRALCASNADKNTLDEGGANSHHEAAPHFFLFSRSPWFDKWIEAWTPPLRFASSVERVYVLATIAIVFVPNTNARRAVQRDAYNQLDRNENTYTRTRSLNHFDVKFNRSHDSFTSHFVLCFRQFDFCACMWLPLNWRIEWTIQTHAALVQFIFRFRSQRIHKEFATDFIDDFLVSLNLNGSLVIHKWTKGRKIENRETKFGRRNRTDFCCAILMWREDTKEIFEIFCEWRKTAKICGRKNIWIFGEKSELRTFWQFC